jgi:hypothetical protein
VSYQFDDYLNYKWLQSNSSTKNSKLFGWIVFFCLFDIFVRILKLLVTLCESEFEFWTMSGKPENVICFNWFLKLTFVLVNSLIVFMQVFRKCKPRMQIIDFQIQAFLSSHVLLSTDVLGCFWHVWWSIFAKCIYF